MRVEEIAIRQEIRQMLCEAGINKNTLKNMVKEVLCEELNKACKQAMNETDIDTLVRNKVDYSFQRSVQDMFKSEIRDRVSGVFNRMKISIDITDENGTSSITR